MHISSVSVVCRDFNHQQGFASETVEFRSGSDTCKGVLTRPAGSSGDVPLVIMAGGWCYTKEFVMPWYGKFFEDLGCATLRFNYRRFGESTGDPGNTSIPGISQTASMKEERV